MTEREAIEAINGFRRICYTNDITGMEKARKDEEAIDTAISALEKQIPKKPRIDYNGVIHKEHCPNCNRSLFPNEHHCECGQRIDWKEIQNESC